MDILPTINPLSREPLLGLSTDPLSPSSCPRSYWMPPKMINQNYSYLVQELRGLMGILGCFLIACPHRGHIVPISTCVSSSVVFSRFMSKLLNKNFDIYFCHNQMAHFLLSWFPDLRTEEKFFLVFMNKSTGLHFDSINHLNTIYNLKKKPG